MIRCNQCWVPKPHRDFPPGSTHNCSACIERHRRGERAGRSVDFDTQRRLRVLWQPRSQVEKLGPIPCSTTAGYTCPTSCSFRGNGCFAEFGFGGWQWKRLSRGELGISWREFLANVRALPNGQLWRHNLAGDLPGEGNRLAPRLLRDLVEANAGRRGFTFTHKPLTTSTQTAIRNANAAGFAVNLSADTLIQADRMAGLRIAPVVVTLPSSAGAFTTTPRGRVVVTCPAQTRRPRLRDCKSCGLCAKTDRVVIVGFRAHGQMAKRISLRVA